MKIELLKNKQTSVIEKIVINKGSRNRFSSIPFNLTHDQTMVDLDAIDLEWHEMIMDYSYRSSILNLRQRVFRDFDNNRKLNYLINLLDYVHKSKFNFIAKADSIEAWFFNYYLWTIFYLISRRVSPKVVTNSVIKIVDPAILLYAEGKEYIKKYDMFYNDEIATELLDCLWNHNLSNSIDEIYKCFIKYKYNNETINLEIFKKELLKLSDVKNKDWVYWNSKKTMISELIIDLIDEKLHYNALNF